MNAAAPACLPFTPAELRLPPKFSQWRPSQDLTIVQGLDSPKRFVAQSAPCGIGKSASYVAQAVISGKRCAILTSTKGLQSQVLADFGCLGLVDIRGRANYPCAMSPGMNCEDGAHAGCPHQRTQACAYHAAYSKALLAPLVVTNYTYWVLIHQYSEGLGHFDMLVCDEAHNADAELSGILSIQFTSTEIERLLSSSFPPEEAPLSEWRRWAMAHLPRAEAGREQLAALVKSQSGSVKLRDIRELARWKSLCSRLADLASAQGDWVAESLSNPYRHGITGYRLDPLWPAPYAERLLFLQTGKILLVSATLVEKSLDLLGIKNDERDFQEYPAVFDPARSPLYYIPTARVDFRTMESDSIRNLVLMRLDQFIEPRLCWKGIVHSVSYARKDFIVSGSRFAPHMVSHTTAETANVVEEFKRMRAPAILVSPSIATGYDFPYDACRWQVICKLPRPDTRSRIMRARVKADKDYGEHLAAQALVQSCGRAMRAEDDWCENVVIDDHIKGFLAADYKRGRETGKRLLPTWFLRQYRRVETLPEPLGGSFE
jgi:ATP-dependent DNA helicase DinG